MEKEVNPLEVVKKTEEKVIDILSEHMKLNLKSLLISSIDDKGIIHTDLVFDDGMPFANLLLMQKTLDMRMDALCLSSLGIGQKNDQPKG